MKQLVRNLSILLVSFAAVSTAEWAQAEDSTAPSSKEERDEAKYRKKQAKDWVKQSIAKKKKALSALKNQKTADAAGKELQKLYGVSGKQTAMGSSGKAQKPENEQMTAEEEKNKKVIEKLDEQIEAELSRIGQLEGVSSSLLDDGIKEMNDSE